MTKHKCISVGSEISWPLLREPQNRCLNYAVMLLRRLQHAGTPAPRLKTQRLHGPRESQAGAIHFFLCCQRKLSSEIAFLSIIIGDQYTAGGRQTGLYESVWGTCGLQVSNQ